MINELRFSMDLLKEFEQLEKSVQEMRGKIEQLVKENHDLKSKLNGSGVSAADFAINIDDSSAGNVKKSNANYNIPATQTSASSGEQTVKPSQKFTTQDLDELLQTDPLSNSVYNRLKPLGSVKQRVLAMQMGISNEKCQTAIERLTAAGGVKVENDMVSAI